MDAGGLETPISIQSDRSSFVFVCFLYLGGGVANVDSTVHIWFFSIALQRAQHSDELFGISWLVEALERRSGFELVCVCIVLLDT